MIQVTDKHNCCGCSACVQACPKQCVGFEEDRQGFCYPSVNKDLCIECGLCEAVCPCLNQNEPVLPLMVYAAINQNDAIRLNSSSGGIFTLLAESVIEDGGVVFGARFNERWEVIHDFTETKDGLKKFRGSKYVQSRIGNTYKQAKAFLNEGRQVLFSGTSCQIAGLKHFLRKEYDNLLTVDVVCHGVPSPLVWGEYLKESLGKFKGKSVITDISFRDKSTGWKRYSIAVHGATDSKSDCHFVKEPFEDNIFMQAFLKNLCLRPSCSKCPAKSGKCHSDITLADFWGIERLCPDLDDDKGVSSLLINSLKGESVVKRIVNVKFEPVTYYDVLRCNPSIEYSMKETKYVNDFWRSFHVSGFAACNRILVKMREPFAVRLYNRLRSNLSKLRRSKGRV